MTTAQSLPADPADIRSAHNAIFNPSLTLQKLKDTAIDGHLATILASHKSTPSSGRQEQQQKSDDHIHIPGRSIAWKVFLIPQPPLTSELSPSTTSPLSTLTTSRKEYVRVLKHRMRAPDGSYGPDVSIPGEEKLPSVADPKQPGGDWDRNNPLSLDEENPWQDYFASMELKRTIAQDVERTFPEFPYFRQPHVQSALTTILFLHCVEHPGIGYRQGMHELLAPIYYVVDHDSIDPSSSTPEDVKDLCDRTWVAADSWVLFGIIMTAAREWYEWQEPPVATPYVAPIITVCNAIQNEYLRKVDPSLWGKLRDGGIEPQIFGIRWLRLLFSREFGMADILPLWDGMFAADPSLDIAKWVCVAMLVRIRNELIPSDYSGQLTALLRYPPPPPQEHTSIIPHTNLLLRQALLIRAGPHPSAGVTIMMENRDFLSIPAEVPEPRSNRGQRRGGRPPIRGRGGGQMDGRSGFPDMLANRLFDVNSAVFSTVSELRRNLPELNLNEISAALLRPQSEEPESNAFPYAAMSRKINSTSTSAAGPEPSRFEQERIRAGQVKLGQAMDWALEVLQDEKKSEDEDAQRKRAWECLSYVRDVLKHGASLEQVDDKRLLQDPDAAIPPRIQFASSPPPSSSRASPFSRHESSTTTNAIRPGLGSGFTATRQNSAISLHARSPSMPVPQSSVKEKEKVPFDPLGALG